MARPIALLVEDNREYALIGTRLLENEGFEVVAAIDGETGIGLARARRPEVVLLDVSLPGIDGFEVCRRIREFSDSYVIMVTARTDEVDRVVGLTVGADDYVTKPFSARELAARIGAMRRRPRAASPTDTLEFNGLSIDPNAREVRLDGEALDLTKIEFDLLTKLASNPAGSSHDSSCSMRSGARTGTAMTMWWTCTWGTCARNSASPGATRASSTRCAAWASGSKRGLEPPLTSAEHS